MEKPELTSARRAATLRRDDSMSDNFSFWQWALVLAAAVLVGVAKTGFNGVGILFVAAFANALPSAKEASGVVLPMLVAADVIAVLIYRRSALWTHVVRLAPWTLAGIVAGWAAMSRITDAQANLVTGAIVVALTLAHIWRRRQLARRASENGTTGGGGGGEGSGGEGNGSGEAVAGGGEGVAGAPVWAGPLLGVLIGFTTLVANAAGPLATIYFLTMRLPKLEFVGTGAVFFLLVNWVKVPFMAQLGLINAESLAFNAKLLPAVLAGAVLGRWLISRVNQRAFETIALVLGGVAGAKLLASGAFS